MKTYPCSCGSEAIYIEKYEWLHNRDEISFAIWYYGSNNKRTLWDKLQHCWQVLKTGKPYLDQICLDPVDALELAADLEAMARECRIPGEERNGTSSTDS